MKIKPKVMGNGGSKMDRKEKKQLVKFMIAKPIKVYYAICHLISINERE